MRILGVSFTGNKCDICNRTFPDEIEHAISHNKVPFVLLHQTVGPMLKDRGLFWRIDAMLDKIRNGDAG